ncbi:MAG: Response regulator receiver [Candidatus Woesebacteria bacterium GW2011_GWC1_43_10b]|uniref:Response regulator receiver n=1 Tax=Candidatus Woesebacteria bacterium GW2011_GWC1_43_10b TaxID=1618585 RepID=A0A0G1C3B0_9BACT|nr:MAG: Response regulator receiver [Candidatus Woesebacteria bacterium GW2011_GWC1_43_10b]
MAKEIYIIEDDLGLQELTVIMLTRLGVNSNQISKFSSLEEAREALIKNHKSEPGLILLNIDLPDGNGLMFLEKIRKVDAFKNTPVVVVTSLYGEDIETVCQDLGVKSILYKPFTLEQLQEVVNNNFA